MLGIAHVLTEVVAFGVTAGAGLYAVVIAYGVLKYPNAAPMAGENR